jgi:Fur family ferric uptake transcriptional regulator
MKRKTTQKEAIEEVFRQLDRPLGIEEILATARERVPGLNQATVYRNVKLSVEEGRLLRLNHPTLGTLYERTGKEHHHHFHCRACNRVIEIPGCALNEEQAVPAGFVAESHEVFLFGICSSCSGSAGQRQTLP